MTDALILWVFCECPVGFVPGVIQGRIGHCTSVALIVCFRLIFVALAGDYSVIGL